MTRPSRRACVLIAGGGIGGLTASIALAQRGIASTLLERTHFTEESGAGIQLGPNATRILRGLGVLDAIEKAASRPDTLCLYDARSGRELASMPLGRAIEERYGAPYLTLHRADLHASLLAACRSLEAIELREDFEVAEVEALTDGVAARSTAGEETDGSCLIGADGLWSRLRRLVAPQAQLRFARATAWRTLLPREALRGSLRSAASRAMARSWRPPRPLSRPRRQGAEPRRRGRRRRGQAGLERAGGRRRFASSLRAVGRLGTNAPAQGGELALLVALSASLPPKLVGRARDAARRRSPSGAALSGARCWPRRRGCSFARRQLGDVRRRPFACLLPL